LERVWFSFYNIKGFCYLAFHSEEVMMINKQNGFNLNIRWHFSGGREYAFTFIALFVFLTIIYANSFHGAWQFDDEINILENKNIHLKTLEWSEIEKTFYGIQGNKLDRPLAYLTFAMNYYFDGHNVLGFHVVNFTIHYLAAIFLFLFIFTTLKLPSIRDRYGPASYSIALIATFFWATSPLQVTAVTYIVQRMASMSGLFYIVSMFCYLKGRTCERSIPSYLFFGLCVLAAVLSLGTKENAVMIPFSIWLFDLLLIQGATRENIIRNLKVFVPLTLVALVICLWYVDITSIISGSAYKNRPFTLTERLLTQPRVILFYITLLFYPLSSRLTLIHDIELSTSLLSPWTTLPAILLILSFLILAVYLSRKRPLISFCILFFFLNHVVEGSFIPLELIYEHRNYIPAMFLFVPVAIAMVDILDFFSYKKFIQLSAFALFTVLLFAQGHTVYARNYLFTHPLLLWSDNVKKTPTLSRPYNNLGAVYWNLGLFEKAYKFYLIAEKLDAQSSFRNRGIGSYNLGTYHLYVTGNYDKALNYFESAIIEYPGYWPAYRSIAECLIRKGNLTDAGKRTVDALKIWPKDADLRFILSFILLKTGAYDHAMKQAKRALSFNPDLGKAYAVLGESCRKTGKNALAIFYWNEYLKKNPQDIEANLALLELYARQNRKFDLSRTVGKLMYLKDSKSWCEFLDQFLKEKNLAVYRPNIDDIISIVRNHFDDQFCRSMK